jgi:hypothetical protein
VRVAVDVCVPKLCELELWRAGHQVPVRAQNSEPDTAWLDRANAAGCHVAVTADHEAARRANLRGMFSVLVPPGLANNALTQHVLDGMAEVEARRGDRPLTATIFEPLFAVALVLLLAACGAAPRAMAAPVPKATPWCFAAVALFDGRDQAAVGCFETEQLCGNAQRRALRWGGVAGVRAVSACEGRL